MVRTAWVLAGGLVALGGCTGPKPTDDGDIDVVALGELRRLMAAQASRVDDPILLLVDPRRAELYDAGHLPNAASMLLLDTPQNGGKDPRLDAYDTIVVYGNDPGSTPAIAMTKRLISLRYDDVRWYREGIAEWVSVGLPLVTTTETDVGVGVGSVGDGG